MSTFIDPLKQLPSIKAVKPVAGTSLSTLIMADNPNKPEEKDLVFSCQPDGSVGTRPAGTEGQYEKCRVNGTMATFQPVPGKYYTFAFADVEGL
jgi:hypothetical protein